MLLKKELTIRFAHCDPAGILFFANIFDLCHDLLEETLLNQGISYEEWFNHPQKAYPILSAESKYRKPLEGGQTYQVNVKLSQKRERSLEFTYKFTDQQNTVMAEVKTIHVCIDRKSKNKLPIANDFF